MNLVDAPRKAFKPFPRSDWRSIKSCLLACSCASQPQNSAKSAKYPGQKPAPPWTVHDILQQFAHSIIMDFDDVHMFYMIYVYVYHVLSLGCFFPFGHARTVMSCPGQNCELATSEYTHWCKAIVRKKLHFQSLQANLASHLRGLHRTISTLCQNHLPCRTSMTFFWRNISDVWRKGTLPQGHEVCQETSNH